MNRNAGELSRFEFEQRVQKSVFMFVYIVPKKHKYRHTQFSTYKHFIGEVGTRKRPLKNGALRQNFVLQICYINPPLFSLTREMSKDQYEVLEPLGTGSYGSVFKLRRKSDDKILVWKEINFGGMCEKEKSQLVAEVNILRELRNPFVVRYHDRIVDKPKTRLYIIMEYCSGGDLGRIIKKCKRDRTNLDEGLIWKIFAQCVLALKDCHRRQENGETKPILHRDLKPANILLDASQNIKMGDFGLAKELSSQNRLAQTNVGTPFYMAPEIINEKEYDEKSDIWALGCLMYELAALRPPFDGTNVCTLAIKINAGKFARIPSKYSDGLFDAIRYASLCVQLSFLTFC